MASSFVMICNPAGVNHSDNTTTYEPTTGNFNLVTTEARAEVPVRDAGVFQKLYTYVSANTTLVNTVITLRKSKVDTSVTVTYTSGQTGVKEDTSNTSTFANTDEVDYKVVVANDVSGSTTITFRVIACEFVPTTTGNCITTLVVASQSSAFSTASTTSYNIPNGVLGFQTTEAEQKFRIRDSFTASNLYTYVSANARTTDTTFRTRLNGADGGQLITYTSGQTGVKEDTSNTDTLVAGDDYNYSITTSTGTGSITMHVVSVRLINTSNVFHSLAGRINNTSINFNSTNYQPVSGIPFGNTTEANINYLPRFTFLLKELGCYVSANTIATSDTVVTVRDDAADSAVTLSYAAGQTGLKNDSTNTTTITSGTDEIGIKIVTPNTSGSFTFRWFSVMGDTTVASTLVKDFIGGFIPFAR